MNLGSPSAMSATRLQSIVEDWNSKYPIGTRVTRYKLINPLDMPQETKTRSLAWVLSGHTAVVMVEGVAGCVCLESVVPK